MSDDRIHARLRYALELQYWLTGEQAAQQFHPLRNCLWVLCDLAAAGVIRRQWLYGSCYYQRDDVALVAATLACVGVPRRPSSPRRYTR
jgi:hypothetical protein